MNPAIYLLIVIILYPLVGWAIMTHFRAAGRVFFDVGGLLAITFLGVFFYLALRDLSGTGFEGFAWLLILFVVSGGTLPLAIVILFWMMIRALKRLNRNTFFS